MVLTNISLKLGNPDYITKLTHKFLRFLSASIYQDKCQKKFESECNNFVTNFKGKRLNNFSQIISALITKLSFVLFPDHLVDKIAFH